MAATEVTVLSLGAGVQSTALALMLDADELQCPRPDLAVFADTQAEPAEVYETVTMLESRLSYPIIRTTAGNLEDDTNAVLDGKPRPRDGVNNYTDIPLFSRSGITNRQCTSYYKIMPIIRAIREWTRLEPPALKVTMYLGISTDEAVRIKPSQVRYIKNAYPLVDAGLSRQDCQTYLEKRGVRTSKSSCFFCPYHGTSQWRWLAKEHPDRFEKAAEMDRKVRNMPSGPWWLYGKRQPLADILRQQEMELDGRDHFGNECEGHCGV